MLLHENLARERHTTYLDESLQQRRLAMLRYQRRADRRSAAIGRRLRLTRP